jgi:hypothetical protein
VCCLLLLSTTVKTPVLIWTCGQNTPGVNVTLVNMGPSAPNPALGGQALCRLLKTDQQGSLTVRLDDPKLAMSSIAVSYFEAGFGAQLLYTTGYKREVVTSTKANEVPLLDGEGTTQVALWAPRMSLFRCPDLPNFLTLRVVQAENRGPAHLQACDHRHNRPDQRACDDHPPQGGGCTPHLPADEARHL